MPSISDLRDRIFDQKNIDAARFALQSAVAAATAFAAVHWTGLGEEFVTVISAVFVVQPSVGGTASTGWNRIFATVLGTAIGFALLYLLPTDWGTIIALGVAMLVVNLVAAFNIDWRYGAIPAAAIALGSATETWQTALDRGVAIGLGAAIGLAVSLIIWPDTAMSRTRRHIRTAIQAIARRLDNVVALAASDGDEEDLTPQRNFHRNLDSARETASRLRKKNREPVNSIVDSVEALYNSVLVIGRAVTAEKDAPVDGTALADAFEDCREAGRKAICALVDGACDTDGAIEDYKSCIDRIRKELDEVEFQDSDRIRRSALIFGLYEVYRSLVILSRSMGEAGEIDHGVVASARRIASEALPTNFY